MTTNFILAIFSFDFTNLNIFTSLWLLNGLCLSYVLYIKYIDPKFKDSYPKIDKFMDNLSILLFWINIFIFMLAFIRKFFVFIRELRPK